MRPVDVNTASAHDQFFTSDEDEDGMTTALVREAIQNSLDARADIGNPVQVRFSFNGVKVSKLSASQATVYSNGLRKHLEVGGAMTPQLSGQMRYLTIEDSGTTGLTGSIEENNERGDENNFWGFFRSDFISSKPEGTDKGGSWGVGKSVFIQASNWNACLVVTRRQNEERLLMMGRTVLQSHSIGGEKFGQYGWFAKPEHDKNSLRLPIDSLTDPTQIIESSIKDFQLHRDQPGMSVIIPKPSDLLSSNKTIQAVIDQYMLPIIRGDLTIDVVREDGNLITINDETIGNSMANIQIDKAMVELAEWASNPEQHDFFEVDMPNDNDTISFDPSELDKLRTRYQQGERIAFKVRTMITNKEGIQGETHCKVYLQYAPEAREGMIYFVRGDLRIPHPYHRKTKEYKARALVVIDKKEKLASLLRDAEGPAHENWKYTKRLRENWKGGPRVYQNIQFIASRLLSHLTQHPTISRLEILSSIFPSYSPNRNSIEPKSHNSLDPIVNPDDPEVNIANHPFIKVERTATKFNVRKAPDSASLIGIVLSITIAYDVDQGNPLSVFERGLKLGILDFSLEDNSLQLRNEGCDYDVQNPNTVYLTILDDDFYLECSGFDNRDLYLQINEVINNESKE